MASLRIVLVTLAAVILFEPLLHISHFLFAFFLQQAHDVGKRYALAGNTSSSYALVLCGGEACEVGVAFAAEFLARGLNIALVGDRDEFQFQPAIQDLSNVAKRSSPRLEVLIFDAKVFQLGWWPGEVAAVRDAVSYLDIAVLVNSVALGERALAMPGAVAREDAQDRAMHGAGLASVAFTQALLPELLGRVSSGQAHRSAILFVGSVTGLVPTPGLGIAGASKALEGHYCSTVRAEYTGVVDALCLYPLQLELLHSVQKADGLVIVTPSEYVKASLRQLGHGWATPWTCGWWFHELEWFFASRLPQPLFHKLLPHMLPPTLNTYRAEAVYTHKSASRGTEL